MLVWLVASVGMTVTVKLWWGLMFCSAHLFVGYPGCPVDYMGVWTETARNNIHLVLQRTSKAIEICARFIFWGKKAHHGAVEGFIYYMKWKRCCHCGEKKWLNRVRGWAFLARKAAASKVAQTFELWTDSIQDEDLSYQFILWGPSLYARYSIAINILSWVLDWQFLLWPWNIFLGCLVCYPPIESWLYRLIPEPSDF